MRTIQIPLLAAAAALALAGCTTTQEVVKKDDKPVDVKPTTKELTPKERFDKAVADFDAGKLGDAQKGFTRVAEKYPSNVPVLYNLGLIAEKQGDLATALKQYEAAHKISPEHKPTLLNLGRVYRLMDRFDDAIALYETALKDPSNEYDVELNNNLVVAYRLAKKFDKAEATAQKVLARTKDNPDAYKNLALIYYDQGKYRLAEFISANAKKLDDKDPGVYNNLGLIYLKMDERRLALGQFQKAVSLNKDFAPGLFNLGAMSLQYRDYAGAEKVLAQATSLDPTSWEGFLAYGYALDGQKGRDSKKGIEAGKVFERVLAIKAEQPDAICGAGWAYSADKSSWDKALDFLAKCKDLASTTPQDKQMIDVKMKGIQAMQKIGAPKPPPPPEKKEAAPAPTGPSALDAAAAAAEKEGVTAAPEPPAGGTPAPAPAPAPEAPKKP